MERPDCNTELLNNTYRQFSRINSLLSGWERIYKNEIKPVLRQIEGQATILDIGCGGGDIILLLQKLCRNDGINVSFTGIDPDERAVLFLEELENSGDIQFRAVTSNRLVEENRQYDIVISNHVMHHLNSDDLLRLCSEASALANKRVLFSDIERSDIGYAAFATVAPLLFRKSYIVKDGLISIRRSYRKNELQTLLGSNWLVKRQFPFRLQAIYDL
ncbi:MAG: methyltransferase domain-containing protein [Balneolaceae bacterium]|nr:MAG: methyltransferase domain-containing protein [Balneolaceae bacterium]